MSLQTHNSFENAYRIKIIPFSHADPETPKFDVMIGISPDYLLSKPQLFGRKLRIVPMQICCEARFFASIIIFEHKILILNKSL